MTARAAQCKCGVHGFAMNLLRVVTCCSRALLREARVTFVWRQTACGMRHCFARRIVECSGRRKLGSTSTRWAERHPQGVCRIRKAAEPPTAAQQRIIEAETSRVATLNAATLRASISIPEARDLRKPETANLSLSLGVPKGPFSFVKENGPFDCVPQRLRHSSVNHGIVTEMISEYSKRRLRFGRGQNNPARARTVRCRGGAC